MKINYFNRSNTKEHYKYEKACFRPNLLLSEIYNVYSWFASELIFLVDFEKMTDSMIINWAPWFCKNDEFAMQGVETMANSLLMFNKVKNEKHKSRTNIVNISKYKLGMRHLKLMLKEKIERVLKTDGLFELAAFEKEKVMNLNFLSFDEALNKENYLVTEITKTILERECILNFDFNVEQFFEYSFFNEERSKKSDFVKISLWDFPLLTSLTFLEMKYTRDNLQSDLIPFNEGLKELTEQLLSVPFFPDNMEKIKQLCSVNLVEHIEGVQKAIDESIYIIKSKSQAKENTSVKFCLGIASVETIIAYYEKMGDIEPYMATEIKQQISRNMDLQSSCVFSYYEVHFDDLLK